MLIPSEDVYYQDLIAKSKNLEKNIRMLKNKLVCCEKGRIVTRKRANGTHYYWVQPSNRRKGSQLAEKDITHDYEVLKDLMNKQYLTELLKRQERNLKVINMAIDKYQKISANDILDSKSNQFKQDWKRIMNWGAKKEYENPQYAKKPFDPNSHIHQISSGEWVRSKGEVIIIEKLISRGYMYHYEERFPIKHPRGFWLYPDIKVILPNGEYIWWEHCGMLDNEKYCLDFAERIRHYQLNGVTIGKNLIITADDIKGDCSGQIIDKIIDFYITPHYQK